jgi:hypothetical protein
MRLMALAAIFVYFAFAWSRSRRGATDRTNDRRVRLFGQEAAARLLWSPAPDHAGATTGWYVSVRGTPWPTAHRRGEPESPDR